MNKLEHSELIVVDIHAERKEEACVSLINDFVVPELQKVGVLRISANNEAMHLVLQLDLFCFIVVNIPF